MRFYTIDRGYIKYLKQVEPKVPNTDYTSHAKFFCGPVMTANGMHYYVPVSSKKMVRQTSFPLLSRKGQILGSLRLGYMIPAPDQTVTMLDFSKEEAPYKFLLLEEWRFCQRYRKTISGRAQVLYEAAAIQGLPDFRPFCCDFKRLERACLQYLQSSPSAAQDQEPEPEP